MQSPLQPLLLPQPTSPGYLGATCGSSVRAKGSLGKKTPIPSSGGRSCVFLTLWPLPTLHFVPLGLSRLDPRQPGREVCPPGSWHLGRWVFGG